MTATLTTRTEESAAAPTRWALDREGTSVEFAVKTFWGLTTVHGRFDRSDGSYEVGPDGPIIELTIDADSIDTGNKTRDRHLRSAAFFDVAEHPQVRFKSTRVHEVGDGFLHVVGRLEAAGGRGQTDQVHPTEHGLRSTRRRATVVDGRGSGSAAGSSG